MTLVSEFVEKYDAVCRKKSASKKNRSVTDREALLPKR